jgi:hypothetical protein
MGKRRGEGVAYREYVNMELIRFNQRAPGLFLFSIIPFVIGGSILAIASDRIEALALGGILMIGGMAVLCYRSELVIDLRKGVLHNSSGILFSRPGTMVPLADASAVRHTLEVRVSHNQNGGSSTSYVYCTHLICDGPIPVHETGNPLVGRRTAEDLARTLNLPLRDSSTGTLVVREPGQLDEPLIERLKRETQDSKEVHQPSATSVQCERDSEQLKFLFPSEGFGAIIFSILVPCLLITPVALVTGLYMIAVYGCGVVLTVGVMALLFSLKDVGVVADPTGLTVLRRNILGQRRQSISWAELEELHPGGRGIYAISDQKILQFGRMLGEEDQAWVVSQLHSYLLQPGLDVPIPQKDEKLEKQVEQEKPENLSAGGVSNWRTGADQEERLGRLGRLAFPVALISLPLFYVQYQDFTRLTNEHVGRGYRLLGQSDFAPIQSLLLFLGCSMLSFYLVRGREDELPPLGRVVCLLPFVGMGLYSLLVWLTSESYSGSMSVVSALVVATILLFCAEGVGIIVGKSSYLRLRLLAGGAGFVWVCNAWMAYSHVSDQMKLPYGHFNEVVLWVSPAFLLAWGFMGWQVWCGLAALCGAWLSWTASPRAARVMALLMVALLPIAAATLAALVPDPMPWVTMGGSLIPTAPMSVVVANILAWVLPMILFYHWLGQELDLDAKPRRVETEKIGL